MSVREDGSVENAAAGAEVEEAAPGGTGGRGRLLVQVVGFIVSLGLFGWCISVALRPENQDKLRALSGAPAWVVAGLLGLTVLSVLLNGAAFWLVLLPVRRLRFLDVQASNAIAGSLIYLPFKLSVISRFVIHNRRDGVPLMTIGAWMAAFGVAMLASMAPALGAAVWRKGLDWLFIATTLGGLAIIYVLMLVVARYFAGEVGLARVHRVTDPLRMSLVNRLVRSRAFVNLHAGFAMLAHPATLAGAMLLRMTDLFVMSGRFMLAAYAVGAHLGLEAAVLSAAAYYLITIASPAGVLGMREGGATGLAALLSMPGVSAEGFVVIALTVSATEMVVLLASGALGAVWLRPDRLLRGREEKRTPE